MQYQIDLVLQTRDNDQNPFWIIQKLQKPRRPFIMNHWSSVADFFRVSSPQVSLSTSKRPSWSDMYFLSSGSFNMIQNRKNYVNQGRSRLIISWTKLFPDMRFSQGVQKRAQVSEYQIIFSYEFLHFLQKIKNCQKCHVFVIIEWSRFFPGNPALSVSFSYWFWTWCTILMNSYDWKYRKCCY